jgi:hypothetical protein
MINKKVMIESYNKTLFYENGEAKISLKVEKPEKLYKYYSLSEKSLNKKVPPKRD